jgi:hypothetical protein
MEAVTEVLPRRGFTFAIVSQGGSGLIRGRVLKPALEAEAAAIAADPAKAALSTQNYEITLAGETEDGLIKLALKARRSDRLLVNGFVFVTPGDARLVRVEGQLSKNPSFWTTRVHITRRYELINGHNMPVLVESTAQLRFFGASSFRMAIRYDTVGDLTPALSHLGEPERNLPWALWSGSRSH